MAPEEFVKHRVQHYYWQEDLNCARTSLNIFSEHFGIVLEAQVLNAAIGLHGAGCFGAQCGLVEGALMFLGMYGKKRGLTDTEIAGNCYRFAENFQKHFGSLLCRELRPEGFKPDNPPHLCTALSEDAIVFTLDHISREGDTKWNV